MAKHDPGRTLISPPFYSVQIDVAYGFQAVPWKGASTKVKVYTLVIVCILTASTSILSMEGLETHGVPTVIFIDNGTQLMAMQRISVCLRTLENHVREQMEIWVVKSCAHEERRRVERRIWMIRESLINTGESVSSLQSPLMWETTFASVANALNDLPIAKGNPPRLNLVGFELITPN